MTSIKLRTIPIDKVWYEARIYEPIQNESILKAVYEFSRAAEKDPKASFALSIGNQGTFVGWVYSEPLEKPRAFEMFYDIPFTKNFTEPTIGWQGQLNASMARVLGPVVKQRYLQTVHDWIALFTYIIGEQLWAFLSGLI